MQSLRCFVFYTQPSSFRAGSKSESSEQPNELDIRCLYLNVLK
ncbi:hypothetical protein LEP1GSC070_2705 [Leptospira santarosai str. AIM]|nr:hypothetical protein LEP1GSC070_2705 [Leptospira santarosai str. AIM]